MPLYYNASPRYPMSGGDVASAYIFWYCIWSACDEFLTSAASG